MELDNIVKELNQQFAEPLKEYYKRRIIFWNDEDNDFVDQISGVKLDNAKVVILNGHNNFEIKKLLSNDDEENNYLVYNPLKENIEQDWFLDIKLYSDEFRADQLSMWMQEVGIEQTPLLRNAVKDKKQFFNASSRRNKLKALGVSFDTQSKLYLGIMSVVCGTKNIKPQEIIKAVINGGEDISNPIKMDLLKYSSFGEFITIVNKTTGFDASSNIDDMTCHILLSAVSNSLSSKILEGLEGKYTNTLNGFCYDMVSDWAHSDEKKSLKDVAIWVEKKLSLKNRFEKFEVEEIADAEFFPCIDVVILEKLMNQIVSKTINSDEIIAIVDKRKTTVFYEDYKDYYSAVYQVALMWKFHERHAQGFHETNPTAMWEKYTDEYYKMDTNYRSFYLSFSNTLAKSNPELDDQFKLVAEAVEDIYTGWYLNVLSANWTTISEKSFAELGYISGINQQADFYENEIKDERYIVVVSDALRFDVAAELRNELAQETISNIELDSQEASFPSITPYGMASLLPKGKLSLVDKNGTLKVLLDGQSTDMNNRDVLLKNKDSNNAVINYAEFVSLKRDERRAFSKGKKVIYIYHDTIDTAGHNDDLSIFVACEKAIAEIKNIINIIKTDALSSHIIVTADHGFLFTYKPLREDDKLSTASFKECIVENGRRYVIAKTDTNPDYLVSVKGFYNDNGYKAYATRENIRIKGHGSQNYVHGGISLQELVVPILRYQDVRTRNGTYQKNKDKYDTKPAPIALLSANRKVSNKLFNLNFYQKEAVSDSYSSCTYEVYFINSAGDIVSDKQEIIADRTSKNNREREFRCAFTLKSIKFSPSEIYYLVIRDKDGLQVPIKEEFQIDIAMAFDDFNFFM